MSNAFYFSDVLFKFLCFYRTFISDLATAVSQYTRDWVFERNLFSSISRLAVDMKLFIHIHIHIHRFSVYIHGYIHIHRLQMPSSIGLDYFM